MKAILKSVIHWPFCYQDSREDGGRHPQHNRCKKCSERDCTNIGVRGLDYYECSSGFSCIGLSFMGEKLYLNGLIQSSTNQNFHGKQRKIYRNYIIGQSDIDYLRSLLLEIERFVSGEANTQVKDSVSFLHDIRTSVGIVLSWCQAIIDKQPGVSFEDKLQYVDAEMRNLFTSINLLKEQLSLADIIANPTSITYGKMHRSDLYGFIYKHVKLFEPLAGNTGCKITMKGKHTEAKIEAYNSFQFIPLILLDNAVKYSWKGREIIVQIQEEGIEISLTVSSYGRIVPAEFREKIFERYVRGPNVEQKHPQGMGMGLYIASLIARAHSTSISYQCRLDNDDSGYNEFVIKMKKIA